jgi:hypothetical protein
LYIGIWSIAKYLPMESIKFSIRNYGIITCLIVVFSAQTYAQNAPEWTLAKNHAGRLVSLKDSPTENYFYGVGNLYLNNFTYDSSNVVTTAGYGDAVLYKFDYSGNIVWAERVADYIDGSVTAFKANDLFVTNNAIYICGEARANYIVFGNDTLIPENNSTEDAFVVKMDFNKQKLWGRIFKGDSDNFATAITVDSNNDIIIGGHFYSSSLTLFFTVLNKINTNNQLTYPDIFLAKYNSNGNFIWAQNYNSLNGKGEIADMVCGQNNEIYAIGYQEGLDFGTGALNSSGNEDHFYVARFNTLSNCEWAVSTQTMTTSYGRKIELDQNGDLVIMGDMDPSMVINNVSITQNSFGFIQFGVFLVKFDENGNLLFGRGLGANNQQLENEFGRGLSVDANNNIYISGHYYEDSYETLPDHCVLSQPQWGGSNFFLFKYDFTGNYLWGLGTTCTGLTSNDEYYSGIIQSDSGIYVYSHFTNWTSLGYYDLDFINDSVASLQVTFDSNNIFSTNFFLARIQGPSVVSINEPFVQEKNVTIFPNPTNEELTINLGYTHTNVRIAIRNSLGQLVQQHTEQTTSQFHVTLNQPLGTYFIELSSAEMQRVVIRVVKL